MTLSYLVTGASTGIGEACALDLDQLGHRVFAGVRKSVDADRLLSRSSDRLVPVTLDVTNEEHIDQVAKEIDAAVGSRGLDGLVNNAGIALGGPLEFLPLDEWRNQLEVNVIGQVAVTKAMLPLIRRATGRIVFIGSVAGRVATPLMGPYSASKHAIEAIGETLRHELRPAGIKVVVVEPGAIATEIWGKGYEIAGRLEADMSPEAEELYGDQIAALKAGIELQDQRGIPARRVADVVQRALLAPRPRGRYLVGPDAKAAGVLSRAAPDSLKDAVIARLTRRG